MIYGEVIGSKPNDLGRLETVNDNGSGADAIYTYTDVGSVETITYGNGLVTEYTYNGRNWLRMLDTTLSGNLVARFDYDGAAPDASLSEWNGWRLSPTGQRRAVQERFGPGANWTVQRAVAYNYDPLRRLTSENIVDGSTGPTGTVTYGPTDPTHTWEGHDRVGNRQSRFVTAPEEMDPPPSTPPLVDAGVTVTQSGGFNERDHLTVSYDELSSPLPVPVHDANGNTTAYDGNTYTYDAANRLIKLVKADSTEVVFKYDADGNRVSKTVGGVTTRYLVEERNPTGYAQVMEEWTGEEPATSGLMGRWRFDDGGGTQAVDSSGNGRNGTLLNGPVWTSGQMGGALRFDGVNDYVNIPQAVITTSDTQYSYSAWFNWDGTGGGADGRKFILETTGSGSPWALSVFILPDGKMRAATSLQDGSSSTVTGSTTIQAHRWYQVTVTWNRNGGANNWKLYLNGVVDGQQTTTAANLVATTGLNIGTYRDANNRWFGGVIDEVRVYNRALSGAEIQSLAGSRAQYVYGLGPISQKRGGTVSYYGRDGLGTVRYLAGASGTITDTYVYDAFGILIESSGNTENRIGFTGEYTDADLGMVYLRARWYKPEMGRFWTMDTYEGKQSDPLSLHKYLYAHADPVNNIDPSGNITLPSFTINMGIIQIGMRTMATVAAMKARTKALFIIGGALATASYTYHSTLGEPLNDRQRATLNDGIAYLAGIPGYHSFRVEAEKTTFLTMPLVDIAGGGYGWRIPIYKTIILANEAFDDLDRVFFAALLVHELQHSFQRVWVARGSNPYEREAHQKESDFLRENGVSGTVSELRSLHPNTSSDYFIDKANDFSRLNVKNPAIRP